MKKYLEKYAIYIVLVALILIIGSLNHNFLSYRNLINILIIASVRVLIALGTTGPLITRGTDLSAGRMVGLSACISASLLQKADYSYKFYETDMHLPLIIPILIAITATGFLGLINGVSVAYFNVPPFIATLGMMVIVYGISLIYTNAQPIGGLREDFTNVASGSTFFIPNAVLIMLVVLLAFWFLLNKTVFGKYIYAIGGNPETAEVSGINVRSALLKIYTLAGVLYGLAGVLLAARTGGATSTYGTMYELDAIAACTIGGVSTWGGIGTVSGVLTGVLIFEVLNNGLVILGVSAYWQQIIKGVIIIIAVALDIRKYLTKK